MMKRILMIMTTLLLVSCKADEVEITFDVNDISSVVGGTNSITSFEAQFTGFGDLDEDNKSNMDKLERILENYVEIDEFEVDSRDSQIIVSIEGSIPVTSNSSSADAFFLHVEKSDLLDGYYKVQIMTGADFSLMNDLMSGVNFMLAPDPFHPTKFKISGKGYDIIAFGTRVDGEPHLIFRKNDVQRRTNLYFSEGIYEDVGPAVFVRLSE